MKTSIENIAKFIGVAVWADGVYDEAEKVAVSEIAEALELDEAKFAELVEKSFNEIDKLDEEAVNKYLIDAAVDVDDEEANILFEAALEVVLADGVLCEEEVDNLLSMADALGIDTAQAVLMLADMVKEEPEMTIEL